MKRANFIENLNCIKTQSLLANITQTSQTTDSLSKEKFNTLFFNESANSCNNGINGNNQQTAPKTWFGYQCAKSRKSYHRAKKMHAKHPSSASKASVVAASKMYKKKLNYFIRKRKKTQNKLRKLTYKSPKQFWKILNNFQSKKKNNDINMNDLYIFFQGYQ